MESLQERLKKIDKLSAGINKEAGNTLMGRICENEELRLALTPTFLQTPSLKVNKVMGGGFPYGKVTIVSGDPDSGKTFLLLETIGKEMERNPDFIAGWLESEGSITIDNLRQFNIDPERFLYISFDKKSGAEKALDRVEAALLCGINMLVINSLKCLVPSEELSKSMESQQIGLQARMNAKMMRKFKPLVVENNVAFVMVQHLSTQIGVMYGDPKVLTGGQAIRYGADIILDLRKRSIGDSDPIKRDEGVKIGVTITKNHVKTDSFPYLKTEYYGIFGEGTDVISEVIELAVDQGVIIKSGAFLKVPDENGNPVILEDGTKLQWQGVTKFRSYCKEHKDFFDDLVSKITITVEQMTDDEIEHAKELERADKEGAKILDVLEESKKS